MAPILLRFALAFALIGPAWSAVALPNPEALDRRGTPGQKCHGQSCEIAALSGSSGKPYHPKSPPKDGSDAGDCCIIRHNPTVRKELYKENPQLRSKCRSKRSVFEADEASFEETSEIVERASCKPYTLIFAKGTSESGPLGQSVGPALQQGLDQQDPGQWSVRGVVYQNGQDGNYCLGLPGGVKATKLLQNVARTCPDTKVVMSGYSQGAMVARNGIAYAQKNARQRVDGLVTFGDPFNGAPVKAYSNPIKVYCAKGDRVCDGRDIVSGAHLSYVGVDTNEAVRYIIKLVK